MGICVSNYNCDTKDTLLHTKYSMKVGQIKFFWKVDHSITYGNIFGIETY